MKKINILNSNIYNKISAGEVVERPSSVVKELVENSIDAHADKITVAISGGGLSCIEITDNGCGIEFDDVETAFMNHSTSKISSEDDLYNIKTLGFRGEALSSIAAVSKVEMISKTKDNELGVKVKLIGGVVENIEACGASNGTQMKVSDLFFNTPARKKFLKKPSSEASEITNLMERLILANPNISFKYILNGETVFNSQGLGLESAIFAVYGKDCLSKCKKINWFYKDIEVFGYIGDKNFYKANRTYQTTIVNGRYIVSSTVSMAVQRGYEKFLTTRCYPFFVLNINLPYEKIDVNVHPNKMEVKFEDSQSVFYAVLIPVKNMLQGETQTESIPEIKREDKTLHIELEQTERIQNFDTYKNDKKSELLLNDFRLQPSRLNSLAQNPIALQPNEIPIIEKSQQPAQSKFDMVSMETIGVLFKTYLILQTEDEMYLVDQHAAHEMMLFEKFTNNFNNNKNIQQPLLAPYAFSTKANEFDYLSEHLEDFLSQGFQIEIFGVNAFKITAVPAILSDINFEKFMQELCCVDENADKQTLVREKIARAACRAAVKAGYSLNDADIAYLKTKLPTSTDLRCPHGRPVAVKIEKNEIEKWFKRKF